MVSNLRYSIAFIFCLTFGLAYSQSDSLKLDSVKLEEVTVNAYLEERPVLKLPASVAVIDMTQILYQPSQSLVPVLNTVPGVRMEERSPGSYRLSIRGSLIRSPFGVRNTKIYLDEFPLTNAGGDAYLNLLDMSSISSIEILKGPDGSLFGANSGGVVRISPVNLKSGSSVNIGVGAGSFGLFQQNVGVQQHFKNNTLSINQAWQRSDGYRKNSAMDRKYFQVADQFNYSTKGLVKLFLFYSDLNYETPGGLTLAQFKEDPTAARPATKFIPGAEEQKAGIRNRTLFGGIQHEIKFTEQIKHVIAIFGSRTLFENPFITNYETRDEMNAGLRTWFEFKNKAESGIRLTYNIGVESQDLQSHINNYGNDHGTKDTIQAADELTVNQGFIFTRLVADFYNKWTVEASLSYNYNTFTYSRKQPVNSGFNEKRFDPQFMPRVAASYLLTNYVSLRAIVSRGYSPPTLQEIRPSDNTINTSLQPEDGWNYETGFRLRTKDNRFWWDASIFYYQLNNAIVKRINDAGQDYFANAGGTYQPGLESQITFELIKPTATKWIRRLTLSNAYTFQAYTFHNYINAPDNFSGNRVTGVPQNISVTGLTVQLPLGFYLFIQHNFTDRIPLNDANNEYAAGYHLVQAKAGWVYKSRKRFRMEISVGADNLLDQTYSLGNDLNAVGNRYYNAAPGRNYFSKLNLWF
jgi:iron complex outermembrane receptor protein